MAVILMKYSAGAEILAPVHATRIHKVILQETTYGDDGTVHITTYQMSNP